MNLNTLSDGDLIDFVYSELACTKIRDNVSDFSDSKKWREVVSEMEIAMATVYRIALFNQQIMNGGLIQYFDNGYGIFAYETVEDLKRIGANLSSKILENCLENINPKKNSEHRFIELVTERGYENYGYSIVENLEKLDNQYYELNEKENLEKLLADYLRQQKEI